MTEHPVFFGHGPVDAAAPAARQARVASTRNRPRRRHPAQGARIAALGIGATTMAGLVGVMGYTQSSSATPAPTTPAAMVSNADGTPDGGGTTGAAPATTSADGTRLTARPTVRQALPADQAPAASTSGSG